MPSAAAVEFRRARASAAMLIVASGARPRVHGNFPTHKVVCLHAALAMFVAAWEAYLERLVREVQREIADNSQVRLSAVLSLLSRITEADVKRFNTPNVSNSRELLIMHTGYDPISDWHWSGGSLTGVQARARLDEILRIRHSFAHGFSVPTDIQWARNRNTSGTLTTMALKSVDRFLTHLVKVTDKGVSLHISLIYGQTPNW
jgi:hypothetical protein